MTIKPFVVILMTNSLKNKIELFCENAALI